jgi:hypothetical protein
MHRKNLAKANIRPRLNKSGFQIDPVNLLHLGPTYLPASFSLTFFWVRFWAFLGKRSSKTPQKKFGKKPVSKTFSKISRKFRENFDVLDFFCFIAFSCVFQRWEFKSTTKNIEKLNPTLVLFLASDPPTVQTVIRGPPFATFAPARPETGRDGLPRSVSP